MSGGRLLVDSPGPEGASIPADDPAVLHGEALFETMRAEGGRIVFLERHLARFARSAEALGWGNAIDRGKVRAALDAALADGGSRLARVRLTVSRSGRALVETSAYPDDRPPTAITLVGEWQPDRALAEHKTTSYAGHRRAQRMAEQAGCGHAILLDRRGRMGETATANLVCALGEELVTPPVAGILPGVARQVLLEAGVVCPAHLRPEDWGRADELVAVSALRGAAPIIAVDDRPVGAGVPARALARIRNVLETAAASEI